MLPRIRLPLALAALLLAGLAAASAQQRPYELLLRGGTVVDGSGEARFRADVAIRGDRIVQVSREGIPANQADAVLDASGLIVAPGFIDNHAHVSTNVHRYPLAENYTRQGITTLLASLHSHDQPWPLDEYAASLQGAIAPNVGFFAGHTWTRKEVMGLEDRDPTPAELDRMRDLVDRTMQQGALGFSTGLLYVPGNYAKTEELIELAKVAGQRGGIYVTHMRDEGPGLLDSVRETIRISREGGLPAQINHHKAVGAGQWGWSERSLALIDAAREEGLDVKHDLYPYTASSTGSTILFPQWALAGGAGEFRRRVNDPETRARIEREAAELFQHRTGGELARIQFRSLRSAPEYNGKTLADYVRDRGLPETAEAGLATVIDLQLAGGFSAIYHSMAEEDVVRIMQHPWAMFETDGDPVGYGEGFPHPRSYGAFPRVLARYVREQQVISLEEAIHKMSRMPAEQIGQPERGLIAEGMYADIVVFDFDRIEDRATYTDPHQYSVGIIHMLVNGVPVLRRSGYTGERPGRVLTGPARPENARSEQPRLLSRVGG